MKFFIILISLACASIGFAQEETKQEVPRFTKQAIGNSGCFAYLPKTDAVLQVAEDWSQDSSKVYTTEVNQGDFNFALIVVKIVNTQMTSATEKEEMLTMYLDYLRESFAIGASAGYGYGHTMESYPTAVGVIDYWIDTDEIKWAIKAWANENTIAVMMLYGPEDYPYLTAQELFLNGFRFNGE
jgi:hypothetical protein